MELQISPTVLKKLITKHSVTPSEIYQCFQDCQNGFLEDRRAMHKTDPPTQWFIAKTDHGRRLKICFIVRNGLVHIKTAYEPNREEVRIYNSI
jgi:hypothetical protein